MATLGFKAKEDNVHDDLDDFNFDDMDFNFEEPPDDRHPVIKNLSSVGKGVKDYVTKSANIEKFVKESMPVGYGQGIDLFNETKSDLGQLYNGIQKELRPVKETSKRLLQKALPALDGKIPKKWHDRLKDASEPEQQYQRRGDDRQANLDSLLSTIFEKGEEDKLASRNETNEREKIRQGFEQIRHRSELKQLDAIRLGIESQVQYQNRITYNVQRSQLEVSHKQFWLLADLTKEQKRSNAEVITELKATRKNTSLPDFVKQTTHERFKEMVRNKFLENAREGMFGGAKDYLRKFTRNLSDQVLGTIRNYTTPLEMAGDTAAGMSDSFDGMPGMDMRDQLIRSLTAVPMHYLSEKVSRRLNKETSKNSKIRRGGLKASHFVNTVGDRVHEQLTDPNRSWGSFESLREMLGNAAPSSTPESRMEVDTLNRAHEPKPFNRANSKSLDEVIPGLLARIHREIKILRTGDERVELISYDFTKNKFSTEKKISSDLRQRIAGSNMDRANKYSGQIVKKINRGGTLTPEQEEIARKKLIEKSVMGESIDSTRIHAGSHWGGGTDGDAIAAAFNKYLKTDANGKLPDNAKSFERQISLLQDHRSIVGGIGDPRVIIQQLVNAGQLESLKESGILDDKNNLDRKVFAKWLSENEQPEAPAPAPRPPSTTGSRKLGQRRTNIQQLLPEQTQSQSSPNSALNTARLDQIIKELKIISNKIPTAGDIRPAPAATPTPTPAAPATDPMAAVTSILKAIEEKYSKNSNDQSELLLEMLIQLEEIRKGGGMGGGPANPGSPGAGPTPGGDPDGSDERRYSSLFKHVVDKAGDLFGKAGRLGKRGFNRGREGWDKHAPTVKKFGSDAYDYAGEKVTNLKGRLASVYGDVMVKGEAVPRLRASLLKAGEYRDKATGKVITSLSDITGDVVDSAGNVVITLEEFYNGYISGNVRKRVADAFTSLRGLVETSYAKARKFIPPKLAQLKLMGQNAIRRLKEMLPPYDVYAKTDMTKPLLYANIMRIEGYTSKKTGKPIKHPRDIDGEVIDSDGNIIVTEQHLKDGLVDVQGVAVGRGLSRLGAKVANYARLGLGALRTGMGALGAGLNNGLTGIKDYFKDFTIPLTDIVTNSKRSVTLLEQIYQVLDDRLPGKGKKKVRGDLTGDGVRDGSVEDIKLKREKAKKEKQETEAAKNTGSASTGGMLGKLFSGLKGLFGKKKDEEEGDEEPSMLDKAKSLLDVFGGDDEGGGGGSDNPNESRRDKAKKRLERMRRSARERARAARGPGRLSRAGSRIRGGLGNAARRIIPAGIYNHSAARGIGRGAGALGRGAGSLLGGAARLGGRALGGAASWATGDSRLARLARWGTFNTDIVRGAGRGVGMLARGAKYLPRALGVAGAGYSAYSAYNNLKEGNYGDAAIDAGMGIGSAALAAGGLTGVLGGLGAVLASPLLIPGLAIAGAGAAIGYAGYKAYKWLSKTKVTNLSKLRLAQYGISHEDGESADKLFSLENLLEKNSTMKDGNVYLDEKKVDLKEIAELFGVKDGQDLQLFNRWYKRRFIPVYRFWLGAIRKVKQDGELGDIEKIIPAKDKLKVAEESVSATADACDSLVGWNRAHAKLTMTAAAVRQVMDNIRIELAKEVDSAGGAAATTVAATATVSSIKDANLLAQKALTDKASYVTKDKEGNVIDASTFDVGTLTEKIKRGDVSVSVAVALPKNLLHTNTSQLDALTSIRFKAYGLTTLSADKARTLGALEAFLADNTSDNNGEPKLTISSDEILRAAGEVFGVPNNSGEHAKRWRSWFNGRFLPVYLLWIGTIRTKTGKKKLSDAVASFPMIDQGALARAIIGAQGVGPMGNRGTVWNITSNPWADNYELNTDPDSTAGNLEAIRLVSDKVRLGEVSAKNGKIQETGKANQEKGFWADTKRKIGNFFGIDTSPKGEGVRATGDTLVKKDSKPLAGMGEALTFSGGGSGNYLDLPKPTGEGWSANKDLIMQGAKMAGIDPKALVATIAVESSFNPNAAPKNPNSPSSAKGFGQHLDGSWQEDLQRDGKRFGIPNGTNQFDARASVLMTASRLKFNAQALGKSLGRAVTVTDLYLAHLMGLGGATKFLKSPEDAIAAEVAGAAAKQHPNYFYNGSKALTVKEAYALFANKLAKRPAELGVTDDSLKTAPTTTPTGTASASTSSAAPATASKAPGADNKAPQVIPPAPAPAPASFANTPAAGTPQLNGPVVMDKGKTAVMGQGTPMVKAPGAKYELILQREDSEEDGMYGTLRFPDGTVLNSLELPWRDNAPRISAIPPGSYECKIRNTSGFGDAYEVNGVQGRSGVLIHAGNSAGSADKGMKADSQGCILLGMDRGKKGNQKIITASKPAMKLFHEKMGNQPFTLIIRAGKESAASKQSVSFDTMRPKEEKMAEMPKVAFAPSAQPKPSEKEAGPAPAMPRLNPTVTSFTPGPASKEEMRGRDDLISKTIAPKLDGIGKLLQTGSDAQVESAKTLLSIYNLLKDKNTGTKDTGTNKEANGGVKAKPITSTDVPVPQRRNH